MKPVSDNYEHQRPQEPQQGEHIEDKGRARHGDAKRREKARSNAKRGKSLMKEYVMRGD